MTSRVYIFDTTLRDGEQSPGVSLTVEEKKEIARALERLKVDIIEAGFPVASPGDFEGVKAIAETVKDVQVAALARANQKDIDTAWEAIKTATAPRIHTFIATSDIHLQYKLRKSREEVLELAVEAVKYAKKYTPLVEFSAEDATRSDWDYLAQVVVEVIKAGAVTVNIPDTVGYTVPQEYYELISHLVEALKKADLYDLFAEGKVCFSVHCHNDLGLAVANSLSALLAGARQVECTVNGIGERAGNAALEEIVMALKTRQDYFEKTLGYPLETRIDTTQIVPTSQLVSKLTGMMIQPNKAIVGANAFAHESGIHQHGVIMHRGTYEIMDPQEIGWTGSAIVLGKHSGRHAVKFKLESRGWKLSPEDLAKVFERFRQEVKDVLRTVHDEYLEGVLLDEFLEDEYRYQVQAAYVSSLYGAPLKPLAQVEILDNKKDKRVAFDVGVGSIDAAFKAVAKALGYNFMGTAEKDFSSEKDLRLVDFHIDAVGKGTESLGVCGVVIEDFHGKRVAGLGKDYDIVAAGLKALVNALNRLEAYRSKGEELKRTLAQKTNG
ncbi:2-isopropylmalate synthase [Thermodesulfatator indicus DSM 15286]|uniref:2-isopropylmalate synthase n=1 Tax=Thermodesulfatator indicus (strain DSM 15286 / JCM 11887 / CIR29812) TaxID=667014 RepID=F8AB47_THEID|nr:2-isopropylmalate synthase [Thermodesulfatator indicus]AEH44419.1 2-isopropylmalate synthase [Thermodesulfatator indicus DSM 15286]